MKPRPKRTKPLSAQTAELLELGAHPEARPMMHELYRRAVATLKQRRKTQKAKAELAQPVADPQRLVHELEVHQVELEMQNAELALARDQMESLLERYTDLYDYAPVGYFTLAANCTILQVNLTSTRLVGIDRTQLVGQLFGVLVAPELRPALHAFLKQVFARQTKQSGDFVLLNHGQPPRAVSIEAQRSSNGQECRVAVMDITERKLVEDKVRLSETRYRRLFETAHDGVLLLDPVTRKITDANPFMTQLLGYPQEQLVGKELFEIGLLKDEVASQAMFRKLKQSHEVRYEDLPLESREGQRREVEVVANLYRENGHDVIQCNIRDITERRVAEREIAEQTRMLDLTQDAIIVRDVKGRIRYWNHGAEELYGWSRKEALGKISHHLLHTKFPTPLRQLTEELHRTSRWMGELTHKKRDGRRVTVLVRKTMVRDRHGQPTSVLETITDITERKRAEEAEHRMAVLSASNEKLAAEIVRREAVEEALRQSERQQRELLAQARLMQEQLRELSRQVLRAQEEERKRISRELHDVIAQTLTGINVRLATLKQEAAHDPRGLDRSITSTQRLVKRSVDVVHEFARELRPAVLDDLGLIPALHSFMKDYAARTGIHTRLTAFAGVAELDDTRRTVLYRVAQEALTNVAKHAHASQVTVNIRPHAGAARMEIKDNGRSFDVERVLRAQKGRRLGLLGMRERLEMVGGEFTIASAPGAGTTVMAQIPFGKSERGGGR